MSRRKITPHPRIEPAFDPWITNPRLMIPIELTVWTFNSEHTHVMTVKLTLVKHFSGYTIIFHDTLFNKIVDFPKNINLC